MSADLPARLRAWAAYFVDGPRTDLTEAADALEAAQAETERLREQLEAGSELLDDWIAASEVERARADRLAAVGDQLAEALRRIRAVIAADEFTSIDDIAREALEGR